MKKIKAILSPEPGRCRVEADGVNMDRVTAIEIRYNVEDRRPEVTITFSPDEVEVQAIEPTLKKEKNNGKNHTQKP